MVGLKTFWLTLFTMLFLGACVPQTKQSKCATDEAFNAQLRTCVPVVPGPTEFIKIINPFPSSTLSRFVNDLSQPINFSIGISNPYGLQYSVSWERLYNGVSYSITPDTATTYSPLPAALSGGVQTGIHVISVKLKDANNNIVDTHNFEVVMGNVPTPYINTFLPDNNVVNVTPESPAQPFTVTIKNNSAVTTNFRTYWTVHNANNIPQTALNFNQIFASTVNTATHSSTYLGFDPDPLILPIGNYTVRAKLVNTATSEVADEQQWLVTIAHPRFSKIMSRNLIEGRNSPAFNIVTNAYTGVSYNMSDTYNFMPVSTTVPAANTERSDFCVTVADGEGAYTGGAGVRVNWYLDGQTLVSTAVTTALDPTVCLADEAAQANIVFNNVNPYDSTTHTITARVFDITADGIEYTYTTADMDPAVAGPISWTVNVKPKNDKPSVAFGAQTGLTNCVANALGDSYSACRVPSDTDFTISLDLTNDDFHFPISDETKFGYNFQLYRNNVSVATSQCTKTLSPDINGAVLADVTGPNYACKFNLRSFDSTGPIAVTTGTWTIQATINDTGSPITPAVGAVSRTMTWNLTATETETAPAVTLTDTAVTVLEGTALQFNLNVTDAEYDDFKYTLLYCKDDVATDPLCNNTGILLGPTTVDRTFGAFPIVPLVTPLSVVLPENFMLGLNPAACKNATRIGAGSTCVVRFKALVEDISFTVTGLPTTSVTVNRTIQNHNPAPLFNSTLALPSPAIYSTPILPAYAIAGNPVSFAAGAPGVITDTSAAPEEGILNHRYQWYVGSTTLVATDAPIDNATGPNLVWTPSLMREINLATENPVEVFLCIEDQPAGVITTPSVANGSICNSATPWTATIRNNIVTLQDLSATPASSLAYNAANNGSEVAVWYDTPVELSGVTASAVYMAMIGNDAKIHVKKGLLDKTGRLIPDSNTTLLTFAPLSVGAVVADSIQNLSMTGTGNSLYIAYIAASTGSPLANHPQVRRIDISTGKVDGQVGDNLVGHDRKFGFDYDGIDIVTSTCAPAGECSPSNPKDGSIPTITFSPSATITGTISITTPKGTQVISFAPGNVPGSICGNCTANDMAASLATVINQNVGFLEGLSAVASAGGVVTINGSLANDYLDTAFNASYNSVSAQIGSIFVTGGRWYLPFINSSLVGDRQDKISVLSGTVDQNITTSLSLSQDNPVPLAPLATGLDNIPTASRLSSYFNGTHLMLGIVAKIGSKGSIYAFDLTSKAVPYVVNIVPAKTLTDIQISASSTYTFAVAKTTGNELYQGIYSPVLALIKEFDFTDLVSVDGPTQAVFNYADLAAYKLQANGNEAYLMASSKDSGLYQLYIGRVYNDGTKWVLGCKDCKMVSYQANQLSPFVNIATAPIRIKSAIPLDLPLYRTSTDGAVLNQGIKNLMFIGYGQWDGATQTNPMMGVLNIEAEQIGAQNIHAGAALNVDGGFFRPPFIKN